MTTFQKIYAVVATIPKGKIMTYKQVAMLAGISNPRIVGFALHANKNPNNIPCHRVIGTTGKLTGYAFGGIKKKQELLKKEGVLFSDTNVVNIPLSIYETA